MISYSKREKKFNIETKIFGSHQREVYLILKVRDWKLPQFIALLDLKCPTKAFHLYYFYTWMPLKAKWVLVFLFNGIHNFSDTKWLILSYQFIERFQVARVIYKFHFQQLSEREIQSNRFYKLFEVISMDNTCNVSEAGINTSAFLIEPLKSLYLPLSLNETKLV